MDFLPPLSSRLALATLLTFTACGPARARMTDSDDAAVAVDSAVAADSGAQDSSAQDASIVLPDSSLDADIVTPTPTDGGVGPAMDASQLGMDSGMTMDAGQADAGSTAPTLPPGQGLVSGLRITSIDLYQTVRVPWMENERAASTTLPLVANKETILRVHVATEAGWSPHQVSAYVRVQTGSNVMSFTATATPTGASAIDAPRSTFNVHIPTGQLPANSELSVALTEAGGTGSETARYPDNGAFAPLTLNTNTGVDVVVVPIQYNADGSGRLPDTSEAAMTELREQLQAMWPVATVNLTVRERVRYSGTVTGRDGQAWSTLLNGLGGLREDDSVANNVYYLGLFSPSATFAQFCSGGCIAGIAPLNSDNDPALRFGLALGYSDDANRYAAIHELGHAHGRPHAPCGDVAGVDRQFPHTGGAVGVWGFDAKTGGLFPPDSTDLMGYCQNQWLSDYTYQAVFTRVQTITGPGARTLRLTEAHHLFTLSPFTRPQWSGQRDVQPALANEANALALEAFDASGRSLGQVLARTVALSMDGFTQLYIPEVRNAASYRAADGRVFRVGIGSAPTLLE